jgi:hypothetical protein
MLQEFVEWESFYVIVGSSAGALIGLQFVVFAGRPGQADPADDVLSDLDRHAAR